MQVRKLTRKIIVHCTATKEGKDFRAADVKRWHVDGNGWSDIGYHFVVDLDGTVERGRGEQYVGAHVSGQNYDSIGVCYVGGLDADGKPADTRTKAQKRALRRLIKELKHKYGGALVYGHRDFERKACPCFDAKGEYSDL